MNKVLLLNMPYGALDRQALGLSLLKATLAESGAACDVRYLTFLFADLIGYSEYQWMSSGLPYTAFAGDWSFTRALYGDRPDVDSAYVDEVLRETWQIEEADIARIMRVRQFIPHFLDYCMAVIPWGDYAMVGFTSTFEQNIASLALAKRIKATYPQIAIIFGGANWEGEMGCELHRKFPFVDYVCSGEAENSFPALVKSVLAGEVGEGNAALDSIAGIVYRSHGESVNTGQAELIREMDDIPYPDYSDYFRDLEQSGVSASIVPNLLFESSRGCWWGAKNHCTFCGLNGGKMAFRSKSPRRALEELDYLTATWHLDLVEAVDNILDMKYFNDLLPALARARRPMRIFYEIKANLSRKQVRLLRDAGVYRVQPGIESMSNHVLKLMRKGTTALRNVQLLKWCREYNIGVDWNILYGFPGETQEDYDEMLRLLPAIRFLKAPGACGPIRLDRFSPYFEAPEQFGFTNVRPMKPYKYLYPFNDDELYRIAYYFDFDYAPDVDPAGCANDVIRYTREWQHTPEKGALTSITSTDGALTLIDTRSDALLPELTLMGLEQAAYEYCDELHSGPAVAQFLRSKFPSRLFTDTQVLDFLDSLVSNKLMITDGLHYLSLAIPTQPVQPVQPLQPVQRIQALESGIRSQGSAIPQSDHRLEPLHSYLLPELKVLKVN